MLNEKLLRSKWNVIFHGYQLEEHIYQPYYPQQMENRKPLEEIQAVKYLELLGIYEEYSQRHQKYNATPNESESVTPPQRRCLGLCYFGTGRFFH